MKDEKIRTCSHNNLHGFCPDCGQPVYVKGMELYYQRFQDVFNIGALKLMLDFENVKTIDDFKKIQESMYPKMRQLIEEYGKNIDAIVTQLREGVRNYK